MELLLIILLPVVSAVIMYLIFNKKIGALEAEKVLGEHLFEQRLNTEKQNIEKQNIILQEKCNHLSVLYDQKVALLSDCEQKLDELKVKNAEVVASNNFFKEKITLQAVEFDRLQKQATSEFENIANRILKKNTEDFSEVNQKKIHEMILPLKEKIQGFEKKVEETYEKGLKDQTDLKAELKKLYELNNRISNEANNLTKALKGDVKQQGNWGEVVLERILERSGLTEGQEYSREVVAQNAEGKTIRPDVIINLPDKKHLIIDSKVSLIAYERMVNSDETVDREKHMRDHLSSLKAHVKELHTKHYTSSSQFNTPDFVLLFMPIESSFSAAVEQDQQLFNFAWDHKVVFVSPSTLLATLRTIASIWQQENQTKNAIEIARQSGALYDKFVGFITDIEKIGRNIDSLQKTYDDASKKLYMGSGNLVRRVETIKELGASTTKQLPDKFKDVD